MTNRITPERVLERYKETGIKPVTGLFHGFIHAVRLGNGLHTEINTDRRSDGDTECACALTVLLPEDQRASGSTLYRRLFMVYLGLTAKYVDGFMSGFDGTLRGSTRDVPTDPETCEGFNDGLATGRLVFLAKP